MMDAFDLPSFWVANSTRNCVIAQFEIIVAHES